jgi:Pyruvate/2-oxoacid:ferredoxin oxidoreductase delta subunit
MDICVPGVNKRLSDKGGGMSKVAVIGDNCSGSRYCDASSHCPDKAFRFRGKWGFIISPSVCKAEEGCDKCVNECRHNAISIIETPELCMILGCMNEVTNPSHLMPIHEGQLDTIRGISGKVCERCFNNYLQPEVEGKVIYEWSDNGPIRALVLKKDSSIVVATWSEGIDKWFYTREPNEDEKNKVKTIIDKHIKRSQKKQRGPITQIEISLDNKLITPYKEGVLSEEIKRKGSKIGMDRATGKSYSVYHITSVDKNGEVEVTFVNHNKQPIYVSGNIQIRYTYVSVKYTRFKQVLKGYMSLFTSLIRPIVLTFLPAKKKNKQKKESKGEEGQ